MLLSRLSGALSVRMRLIVLSVIPVIGFVAVGVAYVSSEHTVDAAFASVRQSSRLADASRAFKDALTTMQVRAKEFVAQLALRALELGQSQLVLVGHQCTEGLLQIGDAGFEQVEILPLGFARQFLDDLQVRHRVCMRIAETGDEHRLRLSPFVGDPDEAVAAAITLTFGHLEFATTSDQLLRHTIPTYAGSLGRSHMYALGMTASPGLAAIANSSGAPEWQRRAARWWLRVGPAIR